MTNKKMNNEINISQAAAILGRKGGQSTSERKAASSAANGKLGGRPAAWESAARKLIGHAFLRLAVVRDDDGKTWLESSTLWLSGDGSTRVEDERVQKTVIIGWRDKAGHALPTDYMTEHEWLVSSGKRLALTGDVARVDGHMYTPIRRPLTDDEIASENERLSPKIGKLEDWPSETYSGVVELTGSRDRWMCSLGVGGHKDHMPGTYASAAQAEAALRDLIAARQEMIARIISKRCAPHEVRCVFPPTKIEIKGDPDQTFELRPNRRERRSQMARKA